MPRHLDPWMIVVAAATLLYGALALWFLPPEVFWSGDAGVKYVQLQSLVRQHYSSTSLLYPGDGIDPGGEFFPFVPPFAYLLNGRFVAGFPPAFAALSSIPAALLGPRGLCVIPLVSALALLLVLRRLCLTVGLGDRRTLAAVSIVAFASPLPFYAMVFWEHTLFALLVLAGIALVVPARDPDSRRGWISGLLLGLATEIRTEGYVIAAALIVVVALGAGLRPGRARATLAPLLSGFTIARIPFWAFNSVAYGSALGIHVRQILVHDSSFWIRLGEQAGILQGLLLDRANGLLYHCPWIALAPLALLVRHSNRESILFLLAVALISILGIAAGVPNAGGLQWGPRYLVPVVPILAIAAVEAVRGRGASRRPWARAALLVLLALLAVRPAIGGPTALYRRMVGIERPGLDVLRRMPVDVCVFRNEWFGQGLAAAWFDKQIFRVRYELDLQRLIRRLFLAGKKKFLLSDFTPTPYGFTAFLLPVGRTGELLARRTSVSTYDVYLFEEWTITSLEDLDPSAGGGPDR